VEIPDIALSYLRYFLGSPDEAMIGPSVPPALGIVFAEFTERGIDKG
jgi:hypothetical protein